MSHSAFRFAPLALLCVALPQRAQVLKQATQTDARTRHHPAFHATPSPVDLAALRAQAPEAAEWDRLVAEHGPQAIHLDPQTRRPQGVAGRIPWYPGRGNSLTWADLASVNGGAAPAEIDAALLDRLVRDFIARHAGLFRIPPGVSFALGEHGATRISDSAWGLWYGLSYQGVPIRGGSINFYLKHGNLILWGVQGLDDAGLPGAARLSPENAIRAAAEHAGGLRLDDAVGEPQLAIIPERDGARHGYRQVWEVVIEREGEGNYLARVDAQSGEVLEFFDQNDYALIKGGIYPVSNLPTGTEVSRPLGFANYANGAYADAGGYFTGAATASTLAGKYVTISDKCGAISLAPGGTGDIDFGASSGTDCTTPGFGGAGNTHSARSCYFHTDLIKQKGRVYLPTNSWLQANITANVNINSVCNAFWSPTQKTVNFYRSGTTSGVTCGNTGEIAGVFLHEWGHGMDYNDGNGAQGSGEAMGDTVAMLQLRNSCMGNGFWLSSRGCGGNASSGYNCSGYGNCCSSCSGVRDQDYQKHQSKTILTPANIAAACTSTGSDPCGREVHCEASLAGNTVWDLAGRDLAARADLGVEDAWNLADKLWWESGPTRTAGYTCTNKTGAPWNNGCGSTTWYQTFLAADDDNGSLLDGTPHASTIFAAFDRHGISCGIATDVKNIDHTTCPVIGDAGNLSGTAGPNQAILNWTKSATNAASVDIKRNNLGCAFSFTKIGSVSPASTTTFTDNSASAGTTWYYIVQPVGSNVDCVGPASNCVSVTPTAGGTCTAPSGLANNTAVDASACGATGIAVSWTAPAAWGDTSGTRTWTVLRNGSALASGPCSGALAATTLTCTDTTAVAGTAYTYTVRANNGCGLSTTTTGASATDVNNSPAAPTGVGATTGNCNDITVSFTAGTNSTSTNLLRYNGVCPPAGGATTFTAVTSPYVDATAAASTSYCYVARAVNSCGTVDAAGVTGTRGGPLATPAAPTATGGCGAITVNWSAIAGASSYTLQRSTGACNSAVNLATGLTGTSYSDTTATPGTAYIYRIIAVNGCGSSTPSTCSGSATASTAPAPTITGPTSGCGSAALSTQTFTTYQWNLGGTPISGATAQNYSATASGSYTVTVTNAGGCSATSPAQAVTISTAPVAPVQTAPAPGNGQITVNWNASAGAATYQVKRGNAGGPYANTGGAQTGTSYLDGGLTNGTQYCYVVSATNACGTSGDSNEQCATPAIPPACVATTVFGDAFESGTANWSLPTSGGNPVWALSTAAAGTPVNSLRGADPNSAGARSKCFPAQQVSAVGVPAGVTYAFLSFWSLSALQGNDMGIVQISSDGGVTWNKLATVNYPAVAAVANGGNCAAGIAIGDPVFGGASAAGLYSADLSAYKGMSVLVRFQLVLDGTASSASSWSVDDVMLKTATGVAPATMGDLSTVKSGFDQRLSWGAVQDATSYDVYYTDDPALNPWPDPNPAGAAPAGWVRANNQAITGLAWDNPGVLGDNFSYFYHIAPANDCGANYSQPR